MVVVGEDFKGSNNVHDWRNVVAIDAKSDLTMGLMMDGTVIAIGENEYGQCATGDWKLW